MASKKKSVIWSGPAAVELRTIVRYIRKENPNNALTVFGRIKRECSALASFPEVGRIPVEMECQQIVEYRELVVAPWRIIYRIRKNDVEILSVVDSRRNLDEAFFDRLMRGV